MPEPTVIPLHPPVNAELRRGGTPTAPNGLSALVVDDDDLFRSSLALLVGREGFVVREAATKGIPIRRAIVTLSTVEAQPQDAVAWTDAAGRFSFRFLPAGAYRLYASQDGFQNNGSDAETRSQFVDIIHLAAGENRTGLSCRLSPLSSVSGLVLNDTGDPLPGARRWGRR